MLNIEFKWRLSCFKVRLIMLIKLFIRNRDERLQGSGVARVCGRRSFKSFRVVEEYLECISLTSNERTWAETRRGPSLDARTKASRQMRVIEASMYSARSRRIVTAIREAQWMQRTRDDQNSEEKDACRRIMRVISYVLYSQNKLLHLILRVALTILGSFISLNTFSEIYERRKLQTSALMRKTVILHRESFVLNETKKSKFLENRDGKSGLSQICWSCDIL